MSMLSLHIVYQLYNIMLLLGCCSRSKTDLLCVTVKLTTRHSGYWCLWQNLYFLISYSCIFSYDTYVLHNIKVKNNYPRKSGQFYAEKLLAYVSWNGVCMRACGGRKVKMCAKHVQIHHESLVTVILCTCVHMPKLWTGWHGGDTPTQAHLQPHPMVLNLVDVPLINNWYWIVPYQYSDRLRSTNSFYKGISVSNVSKPNTESCNIAESWYQLLI